MYRKLSSWMCFIFVLGLVLTSVAKAELLAHWKFDEGSGTTLEDSSGNGHHGVISGVPVWGPGPFGLALDNRTTTTGTEVPNFDITGGTGSCTLAFWTNWDGFDETQHILTKSNGWNDTHMLQVEIKGRATETDDRRDHLVWVHRGDTQYPLHQVPVDEWAHHGLAYDGDNRTITSYLNGELAVESPSGMGQDIDSTVLIGMAIESARLYKGWLDDMWLFSHVLSQAEVQQVMMGGISPGQVSNPNPTDEATDVPRDVVLSWKPGKFVPVANGHVVYFGESFGDVNEGIGGTTVSSSSYDPGRLNFGTTYYWRVDEVNAPPDSTVYEGNIWSFTTEPVGYPIDGANITATASSVGQMDFGPEKTIDGSGLDENDLHSTNAADMWLSANEPLGAWIQYEFDKLYKLHEMWVWNSNQLFEALYGFGIKDVTIEYSTDGAAWTALADVPEFARAPGAEGYAHDTTVDFGGAAAKYVKLTATSNWGGLLPQYSISEVRFLAVPVSAREPSPDAGATDVHPDVTLAWRAGREAATHNVYLSADQQAVIDGTVSAASVTNTSYSTTLELGKTYYWRVDEVNEAETPSIWQGDVWSFSTPEYLVVEDFEDYNDYPPYEIYSTWLDGYENPANGSQVGYLTPPAVETTIVHGGKQSMPLLYSNTGGATYSEATRTFAVPQDWTKYGIETLQLHFYGTAGNTGQLYVKINGVKVLYDGDPADLAVEGWQSWDVDLATVGVNLVSVTSLAIGIDGNAAVGTLYVDDIRLYPQTAPVLVGHWTFDENDGTVAADSSGYGNDGNLANGVAWQPGAGKIGGALFVDPADALGYCEISTAGMNTSSGTIMVWINLSAEQPARSRYFVGHTQQPAWNDRIQLRSGESNGGIALGLGLGDNRNISRDIMPLETGIWYHVALTWNEGTYVVYTDGQPVLTGSYSGLSSLQAVMDFGNDGNSGGGRNEAFAGLLDDAKIFDRALSREAIAAQAGL